MGHARQLELQFEDAPHWEAAAFAEALAREAGRPLQVVLTDNRSVLLSVRRTAGAPLVRSPAFTPRNRFSASAPSAAAFVTAATSAW